LRPERFFALPRFDFLDAVRRFFALPPRPRALAAPLLLRRRIAPPRDFVGRLRRDPADFRGLVFPFFLAETALRRRDVLPPVRDDADFLGRREGRGRVDFGRARRPARKPIASLAVAVMGFPVAAAFPASAPITPPTTAPTGPAMLPTTAPVAAPAAGLEIGGMVMFSLGCFSSPGAAFSFCSSGIKDSSVSI